MAVARTVQFRTIQIAEPELKELSRAGDISGQNVVIDASLQVIEEDAPARSFWRKSLPPANGQYRGDPFKFSTHSFGLGPGPIRLAMVERPVPVDTERAVPEVTVTVRVGEQVVAQGVLPDLSFSKTEEFSVVLGCCTITLKFGQMSEEDRLDRINQICNRVFDEGFWDTGRPTQNIPVEDLHRVIWQQASSNEELVSIDHLGQQTSYWPRPVTTALISAAGL